MRFVVRSAAWVAIAIAPGVIGAALGRFGALIGVAVGLVGLLYVWLWLPRAAHSAFDAGSFARAARRFRLLQWLAPTAARERAALLSRAGCFVAAGEVALGEQLLSPFAAADLDASERAVWLNNRACAALADGGDAHAALALADEAGALRPDVPALQHTRGMALLAVGRIDDAITVLDGMRSAGELSPRLEADRCRDLAKAWRAKGETAYADDYQLRADGYRG